MKSVLKFSLLCAAALSIGLLASFHPVNEEEAIKAVIEKETAGYFQGDVDAWADCFKHDGSTLYVGSSLSGSKVIQGWDAIDESIGKDRRATPSPINATFQRTNWHIQQSGNTAFVTYDQTITVTDWPLTNKTQEIRCLEKVKDDWKIVVLNWIERTDLDNDVQKEAIKTVILTETEAYFSHDYDKWAACWGRGEGASVTWNNNDGSVSQTLGFEKIAAAMKERDEDENPKFSVARDNWNIEVSGNLATVRFDQHFTDDQGKKFDSKEHRLMYWDGAGWKIYQVNAFWDYKNAK